jgi:exosome complex component RRP42
MLKISNNERKFLEDGISENMRNDGRGNLDYRPFIVETGILTQTNGSARLKIDNTDILVGIKLEIGEPDIDKPNQGKIKFSVECCPSASPEYEGRGAEVLNQELSIVLERIANNTTLSNIMELKKLCIIPGKLCWIIYVDAMVLDSNGNLFDAISIATRAALHNTLVPKVEVNLENEEFEISDDPESFTRLNTDNVPICITFTKIANGYIVDSTIEEELCMQSRLTVAINIHGDVCAIQKGGPGGLDPTSMYEMLQTAKKIGKQILDKLDSMLKKEENTNSKKPKIIFS